MTPFTACRPPVRNESDGALTSSDIDEFVGRVSRRRPGRERQAARHEVVQALLPLARRIAAKYRNVAAEDSQDHFQVACVGLVKAVDGYDPVAPESQDDDETDHATPHVMRTRVEKAAKAAVRDPERTGIATRGVRRKPTEAAERLPGRHR